MLNTTLKFLDCPLTLIVLCPFCLLGFEFLLRDFEVARGRLFWQVKLSYHLGGCLVARTCCFDFEGELKFICAEFVYEGVYAEWGLVVGLYM